MLEGFSTMIIGIGDNCIDYYLPPIDKSFAGGNVVNVVANLQKHGQSALYVGTVGSDPRGSVLISDLQSLGMNTQFISREEGLTGITEIELWNGEYLIRSEEYGVSSQVKLNDETLQFLNEKATLIHLSLTGGAIELLQELKALSIPMSCDISTFFANHKSAYWEQILPHLDYVFVSGGSAVSDTEVRKIATEISVFGPAHIIVTRGANGVTAFWEGREVSQLSLLSASDVIDPLGAGDAFISGFLDSMKRGENGIEEHLLRGSEWAAEACSHYGAW
jgi:sugar/nucleoside kinase (ribokinase family)